MMLAGDNECIQGALVHFPSFINVARSVGLQLVEMKNFREFYEEHQEQYEDKIAAANLQQLHHSQLELIGMFSTFAFVKVPASTTATATSKHTFFDRGRTLLYLGSDARLSSADISCSA